MASWISSSVFRCAHRSSDARSRCQEPPRPQSKSPDRLRWNASETLIKADIALAPAPLTHTMLRRGKKNQE